MAASNGDSMQHSIGAQLSLFDDLDSVNNVENIQNNNEPSVNGKFASTIQSTKQSHDVTSDLSESNTFSSIADFDNWIAKLEPSDSDAMQLAKLDPSLLTTEQGARLWAKLAAWAQADQIAYYVDDSPTSSDAAYDARIRFLSALESTFPILDTPQSPTHRVG